MAEADRDSVMAWMVANKAGPAAAARQFGIPANRIKQWAHVARQGIPSAPAHPDRPHLTILPPPPEVKIALPPDVETLAQGVVRMALATMAKRLKEGDATLADCAKAIAAVTDRLQVFGDIAKVKRGVTVSDALDNPATVAAEIARRRRA